MPTPSMAATCSSLVYGSGSDWVKNILAAGTATLTIQGDEVELAAPRVVTKDVAWPQLPPDTEAPQALLRVAEFLQMDTVATVS